MHGQGSGVRVCLCIATPYNGPFMTTWHTLDSPVLALQEWGTPQQHGWSMSLGRMCLPCWTLRIVCKHSLGLTTLALPELQTSSSFGMPAEVGDMDERCIPARHLQYIGLTSKCNIYVPAAPSALGPSQMTSYWQPFSYTLGSEGGLAVCRAEGDETVCQNTGPDRQASTDAGGPTWQAY